jgi:hypothetical protein
MRSPLNDLPLVSPTAPGKLYSQKNLSAQDLPARPPSVSLPSIGQEGSEYANMQDSEHAAAEQHRNISPDLPMHAPTASVSQSTAKSRIQTVTRTDSNQAASHGIGSADTAVHPLLKAKASFNRSNLSLSQEHAEEDEHGIPEIGLQVPMLKYAGDVQAPTPTPSKPRVSLSTTLRRVTITVSVVRVRSFTVLLAVTVCTVIATTLRTSLKRPGMPSIPRSSSRNTVPTILVTRLAIGP